MVSDVGEVYVWGTMGTAGAIGLGERDGSKLKGARAPAHRYALRQRIAQAAAGWTHLAVLADGKQSSAPRCRSRRRSATERRRGQV